MKQHDWIAGPRPGMRARLWSAIVAMVLTLVCTDVRGAGISPMVSLRGSPASQRQQHTEALYEELMKVSGERVLASLVRSGSLVPLPQNRELRVDPKLRSAYRYVVPWTRQFLQDLAAEHYAAFKAPLEVTSAVRTLAYQRRLRTRNANAAAQSSHVYGATVDVAKNRLSANQVAWLRSRLATLEGAGLIEATEEFRQPCFHIMVFKAYAGTGSSTPTVLAGS